LYIQKVKRPEVLLDWLFEGQRGLLGGLFLIAKKIYKAA
jgi:hypothetical protein